MREAGLDALIAASPTNVDYTAGYRCALETAFKQYMVRPQGGAEPAFESFCLVPLEDEPSLLAHAAFAPDAAASWVGDIRFYGDAPFASPSSVPIESKRLARLHEAQTRTMSGMDALQALVALVKTRNLAAGWVGLDLEGMRPGTKEFLGDALPKARFVDCSVLLRLARAVKSVSELEHLRRSAEVAERAIDAGAYLARAGASAGELVDGVNMVFTSEGALPHHVSIGVLGLGFASTDRTWQPDGNAVFALDIGCSLDGYFSDTAVTVALGRRDERLLGRYLDLHRAVVIAGPKAIRPGASASAVYAAMASTFEGKGPHSAQGHGLGLEAREYPLLGPAIGGRLGDECVDVDADLPLEVGMVINLECGQHVAGVGSLAVEVTLLVTESGAEPLVPQERSHPTVAADAGALPGDCVPRMEKASV
jgi:Xaa-Pro dipeptidase